MKNSKLLTIAIPTFNRAETLSLLLNALLLELPGLEDHIDVIIGDNASTDRTPKVTAAFKAAWPTATVLRHDQNLGADENFCQCIDQITTRYFWIIGDDDLPKTRVIRSTVDLLERENPDLVYLQSEWSNEVTSAAQGIQVEQLRYKYMSQLDFARRVNVGFTFISGVVVNRDTFLRRSGMAAIRRFTDTSLVQLGWVLDVLRHGNRFIHVEDPCILAKATNSGGYAVVAVFGRNFIQIVLDCLGNESPVARAIVRRNIIGYLPQLIWNVRFASFGDFHREDNWHSLKGTLSRHLFFWLVLTPISQGFKPIAWIFLKASRLISRLVSANDRFREAAEGSVWPLYVDCEDRSAQAEGRGRRNV